MKRIAVGLLSTVVGGTLLMGATPASAEQAALSVRIDSVNPNPVVVHDDHDTRVTIRVRTTDATRVELRLKPVSDQFRTQDAQEPRAFRDGDLWRFTTSFDESDFEGRWVAIADAYDKDGKKETHQVGFSVEHEESKAETRIYRFSADPGSVRKGRSVYFTGRLQVNDDDRWKSLRGEEVEIYFRKRGSNTWKYVTSADTGWKGTFRAKARASRSGEYRAVFDGTDELAESVSRSDWVRVYSRRW